MELSRAKLSLLVTFEAVARTRSVTRAAEELSLTQPALSHSLARLRKMFDDPLFVRARNGLLLTPKAESLVQPVRNIIRSASSLLQPASFDPATCDKEFRIGLSECAMIMLAMPVLVRLHDLAPSMRVVVEVTNRAPERSVRDGQFDMGIWYGDDRPSSLLSEKLLEDHFVGAVHATHPLGTYCRDGGTVTAEQYASYPHVHTALRDQRVDYVQDGAAKAGVSRSIALVGNSYLSNVPLLLRGATVATVPSRLVGAAHFRSFDLVTFKLPFDVRPISYRMYWNARTSGDGASEWIRQLFREISRERAGCGGSAVSVAPP